MSQPTFDDNQRSHAEPSQSLNAPVSGASMASPPFQLMASEFESDEPEGVQQLMAAEPSADSHAAAPTPPEESGGASWGKPGGSVQLKAASWAKPIQKKDDDGPKGPGPKGAAPEAHEADTKAYKQFISSNYRHDKFKSGSFGLFDVNYQPAQKKVDYDMRIKFQFMDMPPALSDGDKKKNEIVMEDYKKRFIDSVTNAWSAQYTFRNVRAPQEVWGKLNNVSAKLNITEVSSNHHFIFKAYLNKTGTSNVNGGGHADYNGVTLYKGKDKRRSPFNNTSTTKGENNRLDAVNPKTIKFASGSSAVSAENRTKLEFMGVYLSRINSPSFDIDVTGHHRALPKGTAVEKNAAQPLSEKRANNVLEIIKNAGGGNHNLTAKGVGTTGATDSADWDKAAIGGAVDSAFVNSFHTFTHEFGHMIGLGEEYYQGSGTAPQVTHYPLIVEAFGKEYADTLHAGGKRGGDPTAAIMHFGEDVRPYHYVTLWAGLAAAAGKAKVPSPAFTKNDWKING